MSPGRNHVPGYAGHIPGLDAGATCTFGSSTTTNLLDTASKINASGSKAMNLQHMPISEVPRERGAPRAQTYAPPAESAPIGSDGYAKEGRLPGYTGFQAGGQHVFAESQGRATRDLRQAHVSNPSDKNSFVDYGESRTSLKSTLTYSSSTRDPVTDKSSNSHVPGYAGHTPTTRDAIGQRFGKATADSLYEKSKKNVWYSGEVSARVPKSQLPREMGLPRETGGEAKMSNRNNQLPGYTGFVQHSKDTFAKTYGETTRQLKNPAPLNPLNTTIEKPFGKWVLAGNNDSANHIPGYGGHVPGHRDRPVGSTFGLSTTPAIFNPTDTAAKMEVARIPKSMYHSGLRMSEKKKGSGNAVKVGAEHWCVFSRSLARSRARVLACSIARSLDRSRALSMLARVLCLLSLRSCVQRITQLSVFALCWIDFFCAQGQGAHNDAACVPAGPLHAVICQLGLSASTTTGSDHFL
jgi:hypothetical protein